MSDLDIFDASYDLRDLSPKQKTAVVRLMELAKEEARAEPTTNPINTKIIHDRYLPEIEILVRPEMNFRNPPPMSEAPPVFALVYHFERTIKEGVYLYAFYGARIK